VASFIGSVWISAVMLSMYHHTFPLVADEQPPNSLPLNFDAIAPGVSEPKTDRLDGQAIDGDKAS